MQNSILASISNITLLKTMSVTKLFSATNILETKWKVPGKDGLQQNLR